MFPSRILFQHLYKAKRPWPPDFSLLTEKHQFSLERRFRRRAKLKWARPRLQKGVRIAQWTSGVFVIGYAVFLAEWGDIYHPFGPIREWAADLRRSIWSTHAPPRPEFSTTPRGPGGASR